MKLRLFATCVVSAERLIALERLLRSLETAARNLAGRADVELSLLIQGSAAPEGDGIALSTPAFVKTSRTPEVVPLSVARNRLLDAASRARAFDDDCLVAFPDDDCWYPEGALEKVVEAFVGDPSLDFWFCRYGSSPTPVAEVDFAAAAPAKLRHVVRNAASITIFFRGGLFAALGGFDEDLGLGTRHPGGEDVDIAIAAWLRARRSRFLDEALIGHLDKSRNRRNRGRNFEAGLVMLARYAGSGAFCELARKLMVGACLCARGELSLSQFWRALGAMARAMTAGPAAGGRASARRRD